jgi:hypothetical protein
MDMPRFNLIETARAIRQSYKVKAEKEAADAFNELLDESKKRCPKSRFIKKMRLVTPGRTQWAGLLAKVSVLEDSLRAEKST